MIIRKAVLKDSEPIVTCLLLAMEDIVCEFIGQNNPKSAKEFLHYFVQKENNQYSYQNCVVVEEENQIIAAINIYDGAKLEQLRTPIIEYIHLNFKKEFIPEDETQKGEYYIDSFGVIPPQQGRGIGSKLLEFTINYYVVQKRHTLGLLVDKDNSNAKRLYLKLGFESVGEKMLVGKHMLHLQLKPNPIIPKN